MKIEKLLVQLTAVFFLIYGVMFTFYPGIFSNIVTGGIPSTSSGFIDMRATYGGLSFAVGVLILLLSRNNGTLKLGLLSVAVVLLSMAAARTLGIIADGNPNKLMYIYLAAEVVPSLLAIVFYHRMGNDV